MVFFHFYSNLNGTFCKQWRVGDPDQMQHSAASDLVLHCLPMSHKKDDRMLTPFTTMNSSILFEATKT